MDSFYGPLYDNPELDISQHHVEVMISCICGAHYRIYMNGKTPIPGLPPANILCKNCGTSARGMRISGHSGGYFNASCTFRTQESITYWCDLPSEFE